MTINETIQAIQQFQSGNIVDINQIRERRVMVSIKPTKLVDIAEYLYKKLECRFVIATALQSKLGFEVYYHFSKDSIGLIINLHVILLVEKAEIESLTTLFVGANWIEREIHELYGINFLNHPNLKQLISDGNWAANYYPYRNENKSKPLPQIDS